MKKNNRKKHILIALSILLCIGIAAGAVLAKYAGEWDHAFGLLISPVEQNEIDTTLRRYFRSNELLPASEGASYTVNGTEGWFTVANALDSSTVSEDEIQYALTWYVSADGNSWTEYKEESGTFAANEYKVAKYTVEPVTLEGTVYNYVKVHGETSSFLQEDIEAVYTFLYSDYEVEKTASDGVVSVKLDTNDMDGDYQFTWSAGITPDNSDPNLIFTTASNGPSELTVKLGKNTAYEFLFFVTDAALLDGATDLTALVTVTKE